MKKVIFIILLTIVGLVGAWTVGLGESPERMTLERIEVDRVTAAEWLTLLLHRHQQIQQQHAQVQQQHAQEGVALEAFEDQLRQFQAWITEPNVVVTEYLLVPNMDVNEPNGI